MAPEFDKKLNERFDDASLEELMPEFNVNREWNRVAEKLDKKKKLIPVIWLRYAAVLAVGLLVSWLLMKQWMGNENKIQIEPAVVHQQIDTAAKAMQPVEPVMKEETVAVSKKGVAPRGQEKKPRPEQPIEKAPEMIPEPAQQEPQLAVEEPAQPTVPKQEPVIATKTKRSVQAVHLLDINNEDKQIMIKGGDKQLQYKDPIARLLSPGRLPDNGNGNPDRPLPIRGFFEK